VFGLFVLFGVFVGGGGVGVMICDVLFVLFGVVIVVLGLFVVILW